MPYDREMSGPGTPRIRARLKWMNDAKGFGFVVPEGLPSDAFLHASMLRRLGIETLGEGAEILCAIGPGPKGPQVVEVFEIFSHGAPSSAPRPPMGGNGGFSAPRSPYAPRIPGDSGPTEKLTGVVKWYKPEKGFGFIIPDDGGKDVFIHRSCLDRAGLEDLVPGCKVRIDVKTVPRGREAVAITLQE